MISNANNNKSVMLMLLSTNAAFQGRPNHFNTNATSRKATIQLTLKINLNLVFDKGEVAMPFYANCSSWCVCVNKIFSAF